MSWWSVLLAVWSYLLVLVLLRIFESRLIYFPGAERILTPPPPSLTLPIERIEFTAEDGVRLVGWIMPGSPGDFWLLISHGNAGNLSQFDRPKHYAGLHRLGLNLLAFDYRGYGESEGFPTEAGLYRDADAAYRYLIDKRGVPADRIILFGHSLGSAVAIDLASRVPSAGLIVEGAFTSAVNRGQEIYPYIPVRWVARSRFASLEKIARVTVPKLFLHADRDEVIPISHGRRLFAAAAPPKSFVQLRGTHGDAFDADSSTYFGSIQQFVRDQLVHPGAQGSLP
jgi:uncharacterized protein